jgi:hypothetical protein
MFDSLAFVPEPIEIGVYLGMCVVLFAVLLTLGPAKPTDPSWQYYVHVWNASDF